MEASHRPKQAQHFSTRRKVQNGNSRVHQDLPDSRGVGIVDRSVGHLPTRPHPSKLKEIPKVLLQVTGVPIHLPPIRTSHSSPGLYNDRKGSETNGPLKRTQNSPIPGRLADQVPVSGGSPSEHTGSGRPNSVLGVDNKSGKIRTETYSGVFVHGLRIPPRFSPCKTHSREMAQTSGFDPTTQVKRVLTARCLMSLIGLLASTEKMVLEGRLHMRPFQFHLKEHWRYPQSLDNLLPRTEAIAAHLDWWQNPSNVMKGADLHPKDHSIQLFTDASNEGWGAHLDQNSTKGLWSDREKRLHINVLELKAVSLALSSRLQGPVPESNSVSCDGQLNSGSLHQQTRRNTLSRDVHSPVEDHDLVPSLPHNIESQARSRVPECDGRPTVQVQPSAVNRMVSAPTGVQTDLPEVVHTSCRLICTHLNHKLPLYVSPIPDPRAWDIDALNINWTNLTAYASPPTAPSQGDPKDQAMLLPDHRNSPRLTRDALVLGPSAALNRDPTTTPSVNDPTQTVPQVRVPQQPPELLPLSGLQQGPSTSQSGPALFEKWCRENSVDFSTPSVKQISDFFMYLYQDLNRRPSTFDGYRTAIVDTLGPTAQHVAHNADLHRLLSSFHRDRPKSSRNLPKWNLSVVLNELTKAPFEPMKDTDLKHLTPKTAFLLALASGKRRSEIHAWVANKVSNLGQWEKVALFPSSDFIAKNQLAREGSQSVSPVTIPALTTIVGRQFNEDRTLCPVRALRYYLDRTKDLRGSRSLLFISFKKGHTSDIRPATLSSWLKQTILLCYKQADQQALDLVQVKAHDIRAFAASKAFYGGVSVDQIMQACHWKALNTFTNFYLKDLTWSDTDNNMYLGPVVAAQQVLDPSPQTSCPRKEKGGGGGGGGTSATTKSSGVSPRI